MRKLSCLAFAAVINLSAVSSAAASELPDSSLEAGLAWRLAFGHAQVETGYGLTVGYRALDPNGPSGQLLAIDVSDRAALARLAGMPLLERDYRMGQDAEAAASPAEPAAKPWYTRSWVWWTVGGIAATAALGGSEAEITYNSGSNNNRNTNSQGCLGVSGNAGDTDVGCVGAGEGGSVVGTNDDGDPCAIYGFGDDIPDACVPADGSGFAERPGRGTHERVDTSWLDAGTGHMGDLVAR